MIFGSVVCCSSSIVSDWIILGSHHSLEAVCCDVALALVGGAVSIDCFLFRSRDHYFLCSFIFRDRGQKSCFLSRYTSTIYKSTPKWNRV